MNIGACFVKYCLCLFNFVFVVFGTALLGLGVWLAVDQNSIIKLLQIANVQDLKEFGSTVVISQFGYVLIALGGFIFVISFLGYCGTIKESRFFLGAYAFFLTLILLLEVIALVLFFVYRSDVENEARKVLTTSVHKFYSSKENPNAFTVTMNFAMAEGNCCGINNYTDFENAKEYQSSKPSGQRVPEACCKLEGDIRDYKPVDPTCTNFPTDANSYWKTGCFTSLLQTLQSQMNMSIIVAVVLGLLQIIGIVFAICVYQASYRFDEDVEYKGKYRYY